MKFLSPFFFTLFLLSSNILLGITSTDEMKQIQNKMYKNFIGVTVSRVSTKIQICLYSIITG
jgi:hypothetical protein